MASTDDNPSVGECVLGLRQAARGDLVAAVAALAATPIIILGGIRELPGSGTAVATSLALPALAFAAGSVAARRGTGFPLPPHLVLACAVRWGARVGSLVLLLGGGLLVLALAGRAAFQGGHSAFAAAVGMGLAALPTTASGSLGCLAGIGTGRDLPARKPPPRAAPARRPGPGRGLLPYALATFLLSLASLAVPPRVAGHSRDAAQSPPKADGPAVEERSRPRPEPQAARPAPAPEEFRYEVPADLPAAEASRWRVVASRELPGLTAESVAAYSGDGRLLAFTGEGGTRLAVFDMLRHARVTSSGTLPTVRAVAWSPDGRRVFCACEGPRFVVLDAGTGASAMLPVRFGPEAGQPRWTGDEEVGFFFSGRRIASLRLDTLRVDRARNDPRRDEAQEGPSLPETGRCALSVRPQISSLASPLEKGEPSWSFEGGAMLAVTDRRTGASFPLVGGLGPGTVLLASPDASRITVVTERGAITHYVGLGEAWDGSLAGKPPELPDHAPDSELGVLARDGLLGAFICAPLVNPLSKETVGPDGSQVRALALLDPGGALRAVETYAAIRPGDVAGCLHYWRGGRPVLLEGAGLDGWWTPVEKAGDPQSGPTERFDRWAGADLRACPAGVEFRGWKEYPPTSGPFRTVANAESLLSKPAERGGAAPAQAPLEVLRFVGEHHRKAGAGDADGFAADYAETADLDDKGQVGRDFIRRDQADYVARYEGLSETLEGPVAATPIEGGVRARYAIRSLAVRRRDGQRFDRRVLISLDLRARPGGGYEITRERAAHAE